MVRNVTAVAVFFYYDQCNNVLCNALIVAFIRILLCLLLIDRVLPLPPPFDILHTLQLFGRRLERLVRLNVGNDYDYDDDIIH